MKTITLSFSDEELAALQSLVDFFKSKISLFPKGMLPTDLKGSFDKLPKVLEGLSGQLKKATSS